MFALSDDEISAKTVTDPILEDCHFIEIPALSETQCGEYLQQLSTRMEAEGAREAMNVVEPGVRQSSRRVVAFTDSKIEQVYKRTHGVPGKVADALPGASILDKRQSLNKTAVLGVAGLILVIALFALNTHTDVENSTESSANQLSALATAPLAIPGQPSEPLLEEPVAITVQPTSEQVPQPVAKTVESVPQKLLLPSTVDTDLYRGYGRAEQADALDEFEVANKPAGEHALVAEQVKVEIIPPEPEDQADIESNPMDFPQEAIRSEETLIATEKPSSMRLTKAGAADKKNTKSISSLVGDRSTGDTTKVLRQTKTAVAVKKSADNVVKPVAVKKLKPELIDQDKEWPYRLSDADDVSSPDDYEAIDRPKSKLVIAKPVKPVVVEPKVKADLESQPKAVDGADIVEKFKLASAKASKYVESMETEAQEPVQEKNSSGQYALQIMSFFTVRFS